MISALPYSNVLALYSLLYPPFLICLTGLLYQMDTKCLFIKGIHSCTPPHRLLDKTEHPSSCPAIQHPLFGRGICTKRRCLSLGREKGSHQLGINGALSGSGQRVSETQMEFFKARFPFYYYYSCLESTGEIFICIKTYIRRREKKRQTRECPTKGFFEPRAVPLSSSLPCFPQRWNLGSRLNGSRLLMERVSPEHTSRRLARH